MDDTPISNMLSTTLLFWMIKNYEFLFSIIVVDYENSKILNTTYGIKPLRGDPLHLDDDVLFRSVNFWRMSMRYSKNIALEQDMVLSLKLITLPMKTTLASPSLAFP